MGLPVRVTRLDASGARTSVPAACWDTEDGLCGEPRLAADADRVVLVTRRGADLRVLESEDGRRWRALSGLGAALTLELPGGPRARRYSLRRSSIRP
ncbi:MAG: hypothetical protein M5U28_08405 [Sandaracinaceae bacterium]|nr:hypothetical protein [Sandaracinaceae bacterium]